MVAAMADAGYDEPKKEQAINLLHSLRGLQLGLKTVEGNNLNLANELRNGQNDSELVLRCGKLLNSNVDSAVHLQDLLTAFSSSLDGVAAVFEALENNDVDSLVRERKKLMSLYEESAWKETDDRSSGYDSKCGEDGMESHSHFQPNNRYNHFQPRSSSIELVSIAIQTDAEILSNNYVNHETKRNEIMTNARNSPSDDGNANSRCPCQPTQIITREPRQPINNSYDSQERCPTIKNDDGVADNQCSCVSVEDFRLVCANNTELQNEVRTSRIFFASLTERLKAYHSEARLKLSSLERDMNNSKRETPILVYSDCSSPSSDVRSDYITSSQSTAMRKARSVGNLAAARGRSVSAMSVDSLSLLKGQDFRKKKLELLNRNKALKTEIEELKVDNKETSTLNVPSLTPTPITGSTNQPLAEANQGVMLEHMVARHVEDYLRTRQSPTQARAVSPAAPGNRNHRKTAANGPSAFRTINVSLWNRRESR